MDKQELIEKLKQAIDLLESYQDVEAVRLLSAMFGEQEFWVE